MLVLVKVLRRGFRSSTKTRKPADFGEGLRCPSASDLVLKRKCVSYPYGTVKFLYAKILFLSVLFQLLKNQNKNRKVFTG